MDEEQILSALRAHVARYQSAANHDKAGASPSEAPPYEAPQLPEIEPLHNPAKLTSLEPISITELTPIDRSKMRDILAEISRTSTGVGQLNPRNPGALNYAIQIFKKVQQRFLSWYTRSLQAFHTAVGHALREQGSAISSIQDQLLQLRGSSQDQLLQVRRSSQDQLLQLGSAVQDQVLQLRSSVQTIVDEVVEHIVQDNVRIMSTIQDLQDQLLELGNSLQRIRIDQEALLASQEAVKAVELANQEQQAPYVQLFRGLYPVLDVGSGRGEFLELLKRTGIHAYGIDSDRQACSAARAKLVEVVEGDLFEHLKSLPEHFLGGVFCARVIEYLPPHLHLELISLCSKTLKSGGLLVIETVNPDSDFPFGRNSRIDPSHLRPVYPEILQSMLESCGFECCGIYIPTPKLVSVASSGDSAAVDNTLLSCGHLAPGTALSSAQAYAAMGRRS